MANDRRDKLREKRDKIDAQLKALDAREALRRRKDDTRRKIIAGALALEHAENHAEDDPAFAATLARLLNRFVTKPQERALFGLPERDTAEQNPANDFRGAAAAKETA